MRWQTKRGEKLEEDWVQIKKEFESVGTVIDYEMGGFDYFSLNIEGVKVSFYAAPRRPVPSMLRIHYLNNLFLADVASIGAMKMETMLRRSKFRDYYDIYSILKEGIDIRKMVDAALAHSDHRLKSRGLLVMLTDCTRFQKEKGFEELRPFYDVSPLEIQDYIKEKLLESR